MGAGGQARVVISLLRSRKFYNKINIFELGALRTGEQIMDLDVYPFAEVRDFTGKFQYDDFFIAIGCNEKRKYYWEFLNDNNLNTPNLISPYSLVDPSAVLGKGNIICAQAFIGPRSKIDHNNIINTSAVVEHESKIGSHCHMAPKSILAGRSVLGDCCFIGLGAKIIDKLKLANGSILGAGCCLIESIECEGQTYVGVPAKALIKKN